MQATVSKLHTFSVGNSFDTGVGTGAGVVAGIRGCSPYSARGSAGAAPVALDTGTAVGAGAPTGAASMALSGLASSALASSPHTQDAVLQ